MNKKKEKVKRRSDFLLVFRRAFPLKSLTFSRQILPGEVSDSEINSSSSDSDTSEDDEFEDGYDDDLMGDAEDRARLEQMTEKEREQELFNRIEKREVLKRR